MGSEKQMEMTGADPGDIGDPRDVKLFGIVVSDVLDCQADGKGQRGFVDGPNMFERFPHKPPVAGPHKSRAQGLAAIV